MRTVWSFHTAQSIVFGRDAVQQADPTPVRPGGPLFALDALPGEGLFAR